MKRSEARSKPEAPKTEYHVEWRRVFDGNPFIVPDYRSIESPLERARAVKEWRDKFCTKLPEPVVAIGEFLTDPPYEEFTDQDTGEIIRQRGRRYPSGPWERRSECKDGKPTGRHVWWHVEAIRRAEMYEFKRVEHVDAATDAPADVGDWRSPQARAALRQRGV